MNFLSKVFICVTVYAACICCMNCMIIPLNLIQWCLIFFYWLHGKGVLNLISICVQIVVFYIMTPSNHVCGYQHLRGTYSSVSNFGDGGCLFLRNISNQQDYTVSQLRWPQSELLPLWEPQIPYTVCICGLNFLTRVWNRLKLMYCWNNKGTAS